MLWWAASPALRGRAGAAPARQRRGVRRRTYRRRALTLADLLLLPPAIRADRARDLGCPRGGARGFAGGLMIARFVSFSCALCAGLRRCSPSRLASRRRPTAPGDRRRGRSDRRQRAGSSMAIDVLRARQGEAAADRRRRPVGDQGRFARRLPRQGSCSTAASTSAANRSTPAPMPRKRGAGSTQHHFHSLRLITSDWHMRRARYEFEQCSRPDYRIVHRRGARRAGLPDPVRRI